MPDQFELPPSLLVALGGNAITRPNEIGDIAEQYRHTEESMVEIVGMLKRGQKNLIVTHGNGPQVGNILMRAEMAASALFPLPLDVCVADSQGAMGYMIQQVMAGLFRENDMSLTAASVITQVLVDPNDSAFGDPTKFIGKPYNTEEASMLIATRGWSMKQDVGRGWRRVVPSPEPKEIVELDVIESLMKAGFIVIAAGGGGIPVQRLDNGDLVGVEAVIDKDLASAVLAAKLGIHTLLILTGVEKVYKNFGSPSQSAIDRLSADEAEALSNENVLPAGSMGPKVRAATWFVRNGGKRAVITEVGKGAEALAGNTGTIVLPE